MRLDTKEEGGFFGVVGVLIDGYEDFMLDEVQSSMRLQFGPRCWPLPSHCSCLIPNHV